jgi:peptide/nickel transport system substrate-binding protein
MTIPGDTAASLATHRLGFWDMMQGDSPGMGGAMIRFVRVLASVVGLLAGMASASTVLAQKAGGTLKVYTPDSPATMSILEEATTFAVGPMMGVFNNLVVFNQSVKQNNLQSIVPDLATEWFWNDDGTRLTFHLRQGVKWHDGQPFTAKDVECTWNLLMEKSEEKLRVNPRFSVYKNLDRLTTNGDFEVTFHLKRPQPAFLMLISGGTGAIYPCHVPPEKMRRQPIGTGPFKFVDYKPNQYIKVTRNPHYWKPGRPYLDGIEYTIIKSVATAMMGFTSGAFDMVYPYSVSIPVMKDVKRQAPSAVCEITPGTVNRHLLVNRAVPPFDNRDVRLAMALALDRQAFIDIIGEGQGDVGTVLQPAPGGLWGMPPDMLKDLPGYGSDVKENRQQGRALMEKLGYGASKRLKVKLTTRDLSLYRDPSVILLDQLKEVYIDGELEPVETAAYFPKIRRKDYTVSLNLQTSGPDPDPILDLFYGCGSSLNWDGYCNPEIDKMIEQQSRETDEQQRRRQVWALERKLAEDAGRPIIFYASAASCWQPTVKGLTLMVNSVFNSYRYEDIWLDK